MGHELRNLSVALLQDDGFVFTAWAVPLGTSGTSLLYLVLLMWINNWLYKQPQLKPLWLMLVAGQTVGGCHLLCSQDGGSGLEVTPQLEQYSQSGLTCFSCRYFWINFGFMWIIQLFFFDTQLKFVLCYLMFLQLSSLFLLRWVFPTKLFYPDIRNYHSIPHLCFLAAVG